MLHLEPSHLRERLAGTAIRSITQPLLVLSLGFSLPALALTHFLNGIALYFDLGLAVLFPMLFTFTHILFVFREPDRLQSEDYRLRDRSLSMLETDRGRISDKALLTPSIRPKAVLIGVSESEGSLMIDEPEMSKSDIRRDVSDGADE